MVENIVFVILVILAAGAGIWVWRMEVNGKPIEPPNATKDSQTSPNNDPSADNKTSA